MDFDTGPKGGLKVTFEKQQESSDPLVRLHRRLHPPRGNYFGVIFLAAVAGISAFLSNVTRHEVTGTVQGSYTRVDSSENGTSFSYRVITQDGEQNQRILRNEPDLFAGKFYGTPTSIQNDMKKAVGKECTFEANGTDFLFLKPNILSVKECHAPAPAATG